LSHCITSTRSHPIENPLPSCLGLSDDELALFDLLLKANISKADRERLKQASRALLVSLSVLFGAMAGKT
jgi:hypothetical protein